MFSNSIAQKTCVENRQKNKQIVNQFVLQKLENAEITCIHILMIVENVAGTMDKNIKNLCDICRHCKDIQLNRPNGFKNMYTYFAKTH